MAVPKKRTGKSAQAKRRANWKATKPEVTTCPNCGSYALAHTVCQACGFYKGKLASKKNVSEVETPVEEVKVEKKTTKKAEKVKAEEVKAEAEVEEEKAE